MKVCSKCGRTLPLGEFYRHPTNRGGLAHSCKECARAFALSHRKANIDRVREYDRIRNAAPERRSRAKAYAFLHNDQMQAYNRKSYAKAMLDPAKKARHNEKSRLWNRTCVRAGSKSAHAFWMKQAGLEVPQA